MTTASVRAARQRLARDIAAELAAAGTTSDTEIDQRTYQLTDAELDVIGYSSDRDLLPLQNAIRALLTASGPQTCLTPEPFAPAQ